MDKLTAILIRNMRYEGRVMRGWAWAAVVNDEIDYPRSICAFRTKTEARDACLECLQLTPDQIEFLNCF